MLDLIIAWIIDPIFGFFEHRHTSGRWNIYHLLPVATIVCVGICWLAERWSSIILLVFGALGLAIFGLLSLVLWIPMQVEAHKDLKSYVAVKKKRAEEIQSQQTENDRKDT